MLHHAVFSGPKETIKFLIRSRQKLGINIEERTDGGTTFLHFACENRDIEIVDFVHNALIEINSDIDFDAHNERHGTPFHYACKNKSNDVAIHLLQRFPNKINVLHHNGWHALHFACNYGNLELVKYIFGNPDFDIDFNITDQLGATPLHLASYNGHFEVVKFLLENSHAKGIDKGSKIEDFENETFLNATLFQSSK